MSCGRQRSELARRIGLVAGIEQYPKDRMRLCRHNDIRHSTIVSLKQQSGIQTFGECVRRTELIGVQDDSGNMADIAKSVRDPCDPLHKPNNSRAKQARQRGSALRKIYTGSAPPALSGPGAHSMCLSPFRHAILETGQRWPQLMRTNSSFGCTRGFGTPSGPVKLGEGRAAS